MSQLPPNVHVSQHPCLRAKLSRLRSKGTTAREFKGLVNEIALIIGCEALATAIIAVPGPKDETNIGFEYTTTQVVPQSLSLVPILRSGLGMVDAVQTILPEPVPVHHLGLYREPSTLQAVEYYNNLPYHVPDPTTPSGDQANASRVAIILDPVIATGGTCAAAIQTLREWGVEKIFVISIIGAVPGVTRAANEWAEATEIWIAGVDEELTDTGMVKPGLGDVGDRLFLTVGK